MVMKYAPTQPPRDYRINHIAREYVISSPPELQYVTFTSQGAIEYFGHVRAVNDHNLTVKDGGLFELLGSNAAGKTTMHEHHRTSLGA